MLSFLKNYLFHFIQFAGFSSKSLAERMLDGACSLVVMTG